MSTTRVFNESVFSSYANLRGFFQRTDAIQQVLSQKDMPAPANLDPMNPNLAGKWQVCQIASAPFRWILAIVMDIIADIASFLGAQYFAKSLKGHAQALKTGFNVFSEEKTHLYMIQETENHPNRRGKIVNDHPLISQSRLTDPKVKKRTFCGIHNGVQFGHHQGICRGESYWFLYLYLKTKNQFSDPRSHMAALGKQFETGGGMDPTLLQSINLAKGKLLDLKIGAQTAHARRPIEHLIRKTPSEWKSSPEETIRRLQNLPPGAYETGLPVHQTAYVKIDRNLGFYFEPNRGIVEINGEAQGEKLYELLSESMKNTGESSKSHPGLVLHVDVAPVTLRA